MRPAGEIRAALFDAAVRLAAQQGGATWREIAAAAVIDVSEAESVAGEREQRGVAPELARWTIKNMVRSGILESVGQTKPAGVAQWCDLYAPVDVGADPELEPTRGLSQAFAELQAFG